MGLKFDQIIHSSMTRATETTEIISKHLPGKRLPLISHCLLILKTASSRILNLSLKLRCYLAISQPCVNVCIYKEAYSCNSACFQFIFKSTNTLFQSVTDRENNLLFCSVGISCLADGKTILVERSTSLDRSV